VKKKRADREFDSRKKEEDTFSSGKWKSIGGEST
jgi:hypothetical protein